MPKSRRNFCLRLQILGLLPQALFASRKRRRVDAEILKRINIMYFTFSLTGTSRIVLASGLHIFLNPLYLTIKFIHHYFIFPL